MDRYSVIEGSTSEHCCFEYSVIDSESDSCEPVAECFEKDEADKIVSALNRSIHDGR